MGYKVQIDYLNSLNSAVRSQVIKWNDELTAINNKLEVLFNSSNIEGKAADSIKLYICSVHNAVLALLTNLVSSHTLNCDIYKADYMINVDGKIHAKIKEDELRDYITRLTNTKNEAVNVEDAVAAVLRNISDIFGVSYKSVEDVFNAHNDAINSMVTLDEKIVGIENTHFNNDFINTDKVIEQAKLLINNMMSQGREFKTSFDLCSFQSSNIYKGVVEVHKQLSEDIESKKNWVDIVSDIEKQYAADLEQEKEDREWIKWVAVGVALVATVALVVATAGAAGPGVCALVGGIGGVVTTASEKMADNYIETGSLTEGMDWSEFTKDCLISGVTGAIGGALGASSIGSAIKQPIEKATFAFASKTLENAAEGVIDVTWDLGEALIAKKPGNEILTILEADVNEMFKEIFVEGVTGFATGYVGGKFDVDSSDKSFMELFKEDSIKNATEAFTENGLNTMFDIGEAVCDPNSTESLSTILKKEGTEFLSGFTNDFVQKEFVSVASDANKSFKNTKQGKIWSKQEGDHIILNVTSDVISETTGQFVGGLSSQGVELIFNSRDHISLEEIWEENMDSGRNIMTSAVKSSGKHISDHIFEDEKFVNDLKKKDYDNDGKVDVVIFDNYMVLKEDYDAAREVAGKGAFKDQSVQDILGLPKKTKVSEDSVKTASLEIDKLQKSSYKARKKTNVTKMENKSDK